MDTGWPDDRFADAGGRRLRYWTAGQGSPTIVLECGLGTSLVDWAALVPALAERGRVVAYDRAGLGASDADGAPRSAGRMAEDLEVVLAAAGAEPPYLLLGHSWGGLVVRVFAHRRPEDVIGLVLVDPAHEAQFTPAMLAMNKVSYALLYALGRLRLLPLVLRRMPPATLYDEHVRAAVLEQGRRPETVRAVWREVRGIRASLADLAAARAGSGPLVLPVTVLSAGGRRSKGAVARALAKVHALHRSLVDPGGGGYHEVVAGSTHFVHLEHPDRVLAAIDRLVGAADSQT